MDRIYSFVGFANSGKTTYLEKLIGILSAKGFRVAVIKHTSHQDAFFLGNPKGKDTDRHFLAGAAYVALAGPSGYSLTAREEEPTPEQLIELFEDADFIFTEGYKRKEFRKIEVSLEGKPMFLEKERYALVAPAVSLQDGLVFDIDHPEELAEHLIATKEFERGNHQ